MNYRGTKKGNYGNRRNRGRANQGYRKKKTKETSTTKFLGQPIITREKKREEEETPIPESIEEKTKISGDVNFGSLVDVSGEKEDKKVTKYPKGMDTV